MGDQWGIRCVFTSDMAHEDNDTYIYVMQGAKEVKQTWKGTFVNI